MSDQPTPRHVENLGAVVSAPDVLYSAYAVLQNAREGRTRKQELFFDLELGDCTGTLRAKIWSDAGDGTIEAARQIRRGAAVKILFHADTYKDALQLRIHKIRPAEDHESYEPQMLFGDGWEHARDILCSNLVFDIETVPATDRRGLPQTIAESLAKHAQRMDSDEAKVMGLSPFFGKVVSLAVGDADDLERITVLVVPPDDHPLTDAPDWVRPVTEAQLLQAWWTLAAAAETIISYNGRGFDVPFLVTRSLIHRIPARVDLLSNRFALRPHLDLYRALTAGERSLGPSSLDVVCWALGIESPKGQMDGSMVAPTYAKGDIVKIAEYNAQDVRATAMVYREMRDYLLRYREDW